MIKIFFIVLNICKKRKKNVVLLAIEMVLSLICLMGIVSKLFYLQESRDIAYTFNDKDAYYFTPYSYYSPDFDISKYLPEDLLKKIKIGQVKEGIFLDDKGRNLQCLEYSNLVLENMQLDHVDLKELEQKIDGCIPAIATDDFYQVGDEITVNGKSIIKIIGLVDCEEYIVNFKRSASSGNASVENMVEHIGSNTIIISDSVDPEMMKMNSGFLMQNSKIIELSESIDREHFVEEVRKYGDLSSIKEMNDNYIEENRDFFKVNLLLFVIVTTLTSVGIFGTNAMQSEINAKYYSILYMGGMDAKENMIVEGIACFSTVFLGYIGYLCLGVLGEEKLLGINVELRWYWHLIAFGYLLFIFLVSSTTFILKVRKHDLIELYRRG